MKGGTKRTSDIKKITNSSTLADGFGASTCAARCMISRRRLPNRCWKIGCSKKPGRGRAVVRNWSEDKGEQRRRLTYPASEKLETIRLVEQAHSRAAAVKRAGIAKLQWRDLRRTCRRRPLHGHGLDLNRVKE